jgi:hypothetical protein
MKLFPSRRYRTSQPWALWHWTEIKLDGEPYLTRLHLIKIPKLGAIMLHWIHRADPQRDLHDHPVTFLSFVLRGSYLEETPTGTRHVRLVNFKRASAAHRITHTFGNVLTLVFATPNQRRWGFHTLKGWIFWQDYEHKGNENH